MAYLQGGSVEKKYEWLLAEAEVQEVYGLKYSAKAWFMMVVKETDNL